MVDPWAGYNQGMQNLGNTFSDLDRSRQAKEQHDLESKRQALLSRALQLQVEDAERQQKMQEGLTKAVNQQPSATFVPNQSQQQPIQSQPTLNQGFPGMGALGNKGYGLREDGGIKGSGFLGELQRPDGGVSTELSIGVNFDGRETQIPLIVPTLSREEVNYLLRGGEPTNEIKNKAAQYAISRMRQGSSPFAGQGEQQFYMQDNQQQQPSVFNTPGQIQQQQPNMERAMLDYYKKNDPVKAQEFSKELVARFKDLASVNPKGAVDWYNKVSGMNLTYEGQNGDYIITKTDDGKIIATDKKNPLKSEIVYEGAAKSSKDFATIDVGDRTIIRYFDGRPDEVMKKGVSPNTVFRIENRASGDDSNPVAQSTFVDPETGKPLVFDKKTGSYRIANVTGGVAPKPSAPTPESAAKSQLVEQALSYMPQIKGLYLDGSGKVNRTNVFNAMTRTVNTQGRQASTLILDAMEAKLRAESGAAVPEPEVKRMAKRYMPSPLDNDETIKMKLNNLEKYLTGTSVKMNRGKGGETQPSRPVQGKPQAVNNLRSKYGIGK